MTRTEIAPMLQTVRKAMAKRDWRTATALCIEILKRDRNQPDAHLVLGLAAAEGGKLDIALRAFETVLKIDAGRADARIQRARCLVQAGRHADAEQEADLSNATSLDNPKLLDLLATVYSHIGKQEKAEPLVRRAAKLAPTDINILSNAAAIQLFVGEEERAADNLERALELNPAHSRSHWQLSKARKASDEQHCGAMKTQLLDSATRDSDRIYLHYALGKEYEDLQQWDNAWHHYRKGAALQRQRIPYAASDDKALFDSLTTHFDQQWFDRIPAADASQADAPIFILGMPRSGSTLVERIIGSHSQVQSLGELAQWPLAVKRQTGVRATGLFRADIAAQAASVSPQVLADSYRQEIAYLRDPHPRFTDKLPNNFVYLPLLAKAFPDASLVHVYRDPMDSCFAMFKQLFADAHPFSYDLDELATYYIGYHRLMEHWRALLGERLIEVHYDTLVQQQEQQTRALLDKLDLPFEAACLEFHRGTAAAATASASQVRQPMHSRSVGRWHHFASHLEPLQHALRSAGIDLN